MRLAAVDVGTNTVRLLVSDLAAGGSREVARELEITRLGLGVDSAGRLDEAAFARTLLCIERFAGRAAAAGAERVRIAGTSALRDATDRDRFAAAVRERTGASFEVLSGQDEGRLSYLGATAQLPAGRYVVCDIGGGSTELSTSVSSVSLDIGSVRLKERCLVSDPPSAAEIDAARREIDAALGGAGAAPEGRLVGVAGTVTTLAALALGLRSYDRERVDGSMVTAADVDGWRSRLLGMTAADVAALGPVERGRADVLAGGVMILSRVMFHFEFADVLVSEHDILDGLVLELAEQIA